MSNGIEKDFPHLLADPGQRGSRQGSLQQAKDRLWEIWLSRRIAPHLDEAFYRAQLGDNENVANAALHYVREGADRGLDPMPGFSTEHYRNGNADVLRSGVNPFWHYLRYGEKEGRDPIPVSRSIDPPDDEQSDELKMIEGHFDAVFYRANYPDLPEDDSELARHYMSLGWLIGYDPNDWFSTVDYLRANPDVASSRQNPLTHYLQHGVYEKRPLADQASSQPCRSAEIEAAIDAIGEEFDADFYLSANDDVARAGIDPLYHYCAEGYREGRDPSAAFSTKYYLESNPDVAESGLNPFQHFVLIGRSEGRLPAHPAAEQLRVLQRHDDLEELVEQWTRPDPHPEPMSVAELDSILREEIGSGRLVVSVSHDNYLDVAGGVQLCIHTEEQLVRDDGDSYLVVFPWQAMPRLARNEDASDVVVAIALNGKNVGVVPTETLIAVIAGLAQDDHAIVVVIHQLLGHRTEQIANLVLATGRSDCVMWLHDFLTLCPKFNLQRNDLSYCGAPDKGSNACQICLYGDERQLHLERIATFFEMLNVHVLAPSVSARALWKAKTNVKPASVTVQPHVKLAAVRRSNSEGTARSGPIRVAYLGTPVSHKGWDEFVELAKTLSHSKFEFYHFAAEDTKCGDVIHVPVHVRAGQTNAMIEALGQHDIDLVLHWASWPETFSLTTFEALAAGAYVLTNENSGNVAAAVKKHRRGRVIGALDDLRDLFGDEGRMNELVAERRETVARSKYRSTFSQMSLPLIARLMK